MGVEDYECPIHLGLIEDNRECPKCNNIVCYKCLLQWFNTSPNTCPLCKHKIAISDCSHSVYLQRIINRQVIDCPLNCGTKINFGDSREHETKYCPNFILQCPNRSNGCMEALPRKELNNHLRTCDFATVCCQNTEIGCDWKGLRKFYDQHKNAKCLYRKAAAVLQSLKEENKKLKDELSLLKSSSAPNTPLAPNPPAGTFLPINSAWNDSPNTSSSKPINAASFSFVPPFDSSPNPSTSTTSVFSTISNNLFTSGGSSSNASNRKRMHSHAFSYPGNNVTSIGRSAEQYFSEIPDQMNGEDAESDEVDDADDGNLGVVPKIQRKHREFGP